MTPDLPTDDTRRSYDVCTPDRLPPERLAFIDAIHQQFLQAFSLALTNYLDTPVKAVPGGIDQMALTEFLDAGMDDACVVALSLASTRGQAWIGLDGKMISHILDILLGAPQAAAPSARSSITEIEEHVLREFFHVLVGNLIEAWEPSGVSLRMGSISTLERVRQSADLDGTALVLNCGLRIQEQDDTFRIAVPVLAVRLAAQQNDQKAAAEVAGEAAARATLLETLGAATMEVEANLGGSTIRLGDLAAMQTGQILVLTRPAGSQLECVINGKTKFRGEWIALGDRHGLQLDAVVTETRS